MKLISIFLTALVAFGGHPCHLLFSYAQQHDLHTTAIMSRNNGISSPTNNNIRNVNVHNEGVVAIAHQDEEARNLKVHEVFAKMKDTLEKKGVMMDGRSSRHLSSNLPHDELVSVFKSSLLLIEIIYSDANAQDKLSASALVSVGILGLLEIINEDQAIAFLNHFESKVGDEMDDGRKLINSAEYDGDGGRHLQTLQEELPVFPITDPDSFFAAIVNVALLIIRNFTDEEISEQITLLAFTTRVIDLVSSSILGTPATFTCPDTSIGAGSVLEGGNCCVQADCSVGKLGVIH